MPMRRVISTVRGQSIGSSPSGACATASGVASAGASSWTPTSDSGEAAVMPQTL